MNIDYEAARADRTLERIAQHDAALTEQDRVRLHLDSVLMLWQLGEDVREEEEFLAYLRRNTTDQAWPATQALAASIWPDLGTHHTER